MIASVGPFLVGLLLQADASVPQITWMLLTIIGICSCAAFFAGRNQRMDEKEGKLVVFRY
jgi:CP family cyanate transporter-like MFS transporter